MKKSMWNCLRHAGSCFGALAETPSPFDDDTAGDSPFVDTAVGGGASAGMLGEDANPFA